MHWLAQQHAPSVKRDLAIAGSRTTAVIVLVAAVVVGTIVCAVVLGRLSTYCRRRSSPTPLPPPQPLAHHRNLRLSQFVYPHSPAVPGSRPSSWLPSSDSALASSDSLLPPSFPRGSRTASPLAGDSLKAPTPNYLLSGSRPSSTTPSSSGSLSAEPTPPPSPLPSSTPPVNDPAAASLRKQRRASRMSVTSSSHLSLRSYSRPPSSRISGVPHGPHSQVEIVLPTPLAPQLYQHMVGAEDSYGRPISQFDETPAPMAMSDPWANVTAGIRTSVQPHTNREEQVNSKRRSVSGEVRHAKLAPPTNASSPPSSYRRSASAPLPSMHPQYPTNSRHDHPPVPRIPSMYSSRNDGM